MDEAEILTVLEKTRGGQLTTEAALRLLKSGPFRTRDLEFAQVDHHRRFRQGIGEVIWGENKTIAQIVAIAHELAATGAPVLITRLQPEKLAHLADVYPAGRANEVARTFLVNGPPISEVELARPHVAVVAAGTSDLYAAEEAAEVCLALDVPVARYYDIGVAGIHRLLERTQALQAATALVVVAGMEGALVGVVAGLIGRPVFGVPTSVGYGANFGGVSALLTMLNSCAPGVSVVNIDNGFSAGYSASQVVRAVRAAAEKKS